MNLKELIAMAKGDGSVDRLFTNARIINVYSGEIMSGNIAVSGGYIVGIGDYQAREIIDLKNRFVTPGLIDAHVHIESSMTSVSEFARAVIPKGTTAVVADPHEIANVMGIEGIEYMLRTSRNSLLNVFIALPSCVPATDMETSGAILDADKLKPLLGYEQVVALGEMMNFPGVIYRNEEVLQKIRDTFSVNKPVDGHAPGLGGKDLNAYASAGITSDHECTTVEEAWEKLRIGMRILIREGTGAKNLLDLLPIINEKTASRIMWCTDDRHPHDICEEGHLDYIIRTAIKNGVDPVTAFQIGSLNPAAHFNLKQVGSITPGKKADLVVFSDIDNFSAESVYLSGELAARDGQMVDQAAARDPEMFPSTMNVRTDDLDFKIPADKSRIRVIELVPDQIITRQIYREVNVENGSIESDVSRDILKLAVVERHKGTGNIGIGFVSGFGLKQGAIASSVAHDSHNIIVVGTSDEDMKVAVKRIIEMNGGLAAVSKTKVAADLPLPIAGLMSTEPLGTVRVLMDNLINAAKGLGVKVPDPFMTLSFLALPVIPELKLTDQGLFDVGQFKHVPLFIE